MLKVIYFCTTLLKPNIMKMKLIFSLLISASLFLACANGSSESQDQSEEKEKTEMKEEAKTEKQDSSIRGEALSDAEIMPFMQMYNSMQSKDSMELKTQATVNKVCQKKGCWMTLNTSDKSLEEPIMVRFRDYGFFVPKDISGEKVIIEGTAYKQMTSVDELKHYAEDAGKSQEEIDAITEPKEEVIFIADGVKIL